MFRRAAQRPSQVREAFMPMRIGSPCESLRPLVGAGNDDEASKTEKKLVAERNFRARA
ncbi:MAG: hypothetical protein JWM36_3090 [Hyphomicrobiales bacterium]|nr:hypothetical protein [Hyphomicrobiales bacterium]